jgi:hypothetical protein
MNTGFLHKLAPGSCIAMGLAISTGHPLGMIAATGMPFACLTSGTKRAAFKAALGYYLAALWPMVTGLERYLEGSTPFLTPVAIWALGSIVLSIPWMLAATADRLQYVWRAPLALAATVIPPLGIIGLASPLTAAGFLLPGTGWIGLATVALVPGIVLAANALQIRGRCAVGCAVLVLCAGLAIRPRLPAHDAQPPNGWVAVNTHLGDVSQPFRDFAAAQFIQDMAANVSARVLLFPESVVPRWSEATENFWRRSLDHSRARGQILVFGAGLPRPAQDNFATLGDLGRYDFAAAIDALKRMDPAPVHPRLGAPTPEPIDNAVVVAGAESATYYQRLPVPIGMWQPFSRTSVPLRLSAPGILEIDHQRAAVLICYEQMLTFPMLASMLQHPTVIVGVSNTFWVAGTSIPRFQANAVRAWAMLFRLPYLLAVNS